MEVILNSPVGTLGVVAAIGPVGREVAPNTSRTPPWALEDSLRVEVRPPEAGLKVHRLRGAPHAAPRTAVDRLRCAVHTPSSGVVRYVYVRRGGPGGAELAAAVTPSSGVVR